MTGKFLADVVLTEMAKQKLARVFLEGACRSLVLLATLAEGFHHCSESGNPFRRDDWWDMIHCRMLDVER